MAGSKPGTGAARQSRAELDRALLLRDVMDHAVKVHKETTAPFARKESHARVITMGVLCVMLLGAGVYSWFARPEFIWGPRAEPLPAAEQEAGLRMAMFFTAQRLEAYRRDQGAYPSSLAALGESIPGVTYRLVEDGVFEMRAAIAGRLIVFRSDRSADDFLGSSVRVIQGFARP